MKVRAFVMICVVVAAFFVTAGKVWALFGEEIYCSGHGALTNDPWVDTALGCVPVKIDSFMGWFLPKFFGVIGGISFLLMVYGFILMTTSAGDPKAMQGARETVTSAVTGLFFSVFALFLLRLIAVGILKLPGLN